MFTNSQILRHPSKVSRTVKTLYLSRLHYENTEHDQPFDFVLKNDTTSLVSGPYVPDPEYRTID